MKKNLTLFVFIVIGIFSVTAAAPNWGVADTLEHYEIGPGIEYIKIRYESVPLTLWATTIDMTNPYNVIEQVQSNNSVPDLKRELVQDMSKRLTTPGHKVCAAFNHDFFSYDEGVCIGLNISNGVISMPAGSGRSTFAITQDKTASVFFPVPECKAISASGDEVTIDHFNWGAETIRNGDCVLFTNMNSLNLDAEGRYIKIRPRSNWIVNGTPTVCDVLEVSDLPLQTSDTDFVLYLRNTKLNSLPDIKVGEEITISQKLVAGKFGTPPDNILQAFHGYPSIAYEGKLHDGEYNDFENGREYETSCRTMAGMSQDGKTVYFVATELSENSAGINCIDIANWMLAHGVWNVVNFDSGGSTAIVVDHTMLNLPGRGSLRPVMDGVLLVSTAPEDNGVAHYSFSKTQLNVPIISLASLTLISQNKYKDVIERNVEVEGFAFRCEPAELGWVDKEAVFHAGNGHVWQNYSREKRNHGRTFRFDPAGTRHTYSSRRNSHRQCTSLPNQFRRKHQRSSIYARPGRFRMDLVQSILLPYRKRYLKRNRKRRNVARRDTRHNYRRLKGYRRSNSGDSCTRKFLRSIRLPTILDRI